MCFKTLNHFLENTKVYFLFKPSDTLPKFKMWLVWLFYQFFLNLYLFYLEISLSFFDQIQKPTTCLHPYKFLFCITSLQLFFSQTTRNCFYLFKPSISCSKFLPKILLYINKLKIQKLTII